MAKKGEQLSTLKFDLRESAAEMLKHAEEKGDEHAFMFITAFKRYQRQLAYLEKLDEIINEEGLLVEKEYVKGRKNLYMNPAINAYNATCASADRTAQLIMKYILEPLRDENAGGGDAFDLY